MDGQKITPQDFQDADELLKDLSDETSRWEGTLSGGSKLGPGATAIKDLMDSEVILGNPEKELTLLTEEAFQAADIELGAFSRQDAYNFYYLTLDVGLIPKPAAQFWRLVCKLDFGPKGQQEPILERIFPDQEWREVLATSTSLDMGLDGNLNWEAGVDASLLSQIHEQFPELAGKIKSKSDFKAFLAIPEYRYQFGNFEIVATGVGSSAFWRIQDQELKQNGSVKFGTVFKVPKSTEKIELIARVQAEPNMNWLFADVKDVAAQFSERLKQLFRADNREESSSRLVRWDAEQWELELPKAKKTA